AAFPRFEASGAALKSDSTGFTLAVAPKRRNRNVALLDFDPLTGELAFQQQIINSGFDDTGSTVVFDVEWSGDGTKLYFSRNGDGTNPGDINQVSMADTINATSTIPDGPAYSRFVTYLLK